MVDLHVHIPSKSVTFLPETSNQAATYLCNTHHPEVFLPPPPHLHLPGCLCLHSRKTFHGTNICRSLFFGFRKNTLRSTRCTTKDIVLPTDHSYLHCVRPPKLGQKLYHTILVYIADVSKDGDGFICPEANFPSATKSSLVV